MPRLRKRAGWRVRRRFQDKQLRAERAVLEDSQHAGAMSTVLIKHNAIDRKLFAMKGFHHPRGVKRRFLPA